jgi:hypothetical protein
VDSIALRCRLPNTEGAITELLLWIVKTARAMLEEEVPFKKIAVADRVSAERVFDH